jgi:type VI secretion system protein ImpJ
MTDLSRVVWREGMHLGQHHFQLQQRYFEDSIRFAIDQLFYKPYGLISCTFDVEALTNGFVSIVRARGLMADGTPFSFPDGDETPAGIDVRAQFSPTERTQDVFLAIPALRRDSGNVASSSQNGDARMRAVARTVRDETTGGEEREVQFGANNVRLCLGSARRGNEIALPIARLRHAGAGQITFDETYVPPLLAIAGSESLMRLAQRIVDRLHTKSERLTSERNATGADSSAYGAHEVSGFWLQHTMHTSAAPLRHMLVAGAVHPEALYLELSRLAGSLCTFVVGAHPQELPSYDHDDLGTCFLALERIISERLDQAKPTNFARIPLETATLQYTSQSTGKVMAVGGYRAKVDDDRALGRAHWILGIRAKLSPTALVSMVPDLVKVCSAGAVAFLVAGARAGFELTHLTVPPSTISSRSDTQYFTITRSGFCENLLAQTRQIGVYVPDSIPDPQVELLIIYDS